MTHPLQVVLEQVGPSSCPTTHNFHCHTICSDGSLEPLELIQQATERGLKHLAVTDHHSSHAHREIQAWLDQQRASGVEVPTCLLYTSPSPRDGLLSRMPSSA